MQWYLERLLYIDVPVLVCTDVCLLGPASISRATSITSNLSWLWKA